MNNVTVRQLNKELNHHTILRNINMVFEGGFIYGVFGRNGSGKTMLFRAICGLIKPTEGSVYINDQQLHHDISFPPSIGVIIETPGFWDDYSGFENLKMLASIKNEISGPDIKAAIERVGLNPEDKRPVKRYSLGMRQRLAIAQAIMEKPDILLLDEPTNALDEEGVKLIRDILIEEKQRGAIVVIASHHKEDLTLLSDRKLKMNNGELQEAFES
ncbi:ATP-binding cassette domain-containing protein [Caldalkalibacillus salinus]|uniref:ATP-binding cassette domain-containing protein n=1 Tax=Caldalkalibacillus salinus TaxID=2803787 RepID=UPI00235184AD|nr:ABC transporter ATP-binding protein [Caldalkalibacillus salinus]